MEVLIDTNVALDVILNNAEVGFSSRVTLELAEHKRFTGYISASAITDIFYIVRKRLGKNTAQEALNHLLQIFYPAAVTDSNIYQALDLKWADFEDSLQYLVGLDLSVNYIVTRNIQDFSLGNIPAITPEQFIDIIAGFEE